MVSRRMLGLMKKSAVTLLLLVALVAPVALFLLLWPHWHLHVVLAAAISVLVGWALNVAWALSADKTAPATSEDRSNVSIATRFGWACPAVLVLVTWLVRRFAA